LASETKQRLNELGIKEALFFGSEQNSFDWVSLVQTIRGLSIRVVYFAARTANVGLLARHVNSAGDRIQIISGDAINAEDFWVIAGSAGEGTVFTSGPDARNSPAGADVVARFRERGYEPEGYTLYIYAAVQAWSQAVVKADTLDPAAVMQVLHEAEFDTVLGRISFDEKGDVEGIPPFVWFVWHDGKYVPLE
jgi:branched-chain amino acid transport system substrate-binding protein